MSVRESTHPVGSGFDAAQARTWIVAGALPRTWARSSIGSPSTRVSPVTATSSPMSVTVPSTTLDTATRTPPSATKRIRTRYSVPSSTRRATSVKSARCCR